MVCSIFTKDFVTRHYGFAFTLRKTCEPFIRSSANICARQSRTLAVHLNCKERVLFAKVKSCGTARQPYNLYKLMLRLATGSWGCKYEQYPATCSFLVLFFQGQGSCTASVSLYSTEELTLSWNIAVREYKSTELFKRRAACRFVTSSSGPKQCHWKEPASRLKRALVNVRRPTLLLQHTKITDRLFLALNIH